MADLAVEPLILGYHVLLPGEVAFFRVVVGAALAASDLERAAVRVQLPGGGPVPGHLGGDVAARVLGDVAGLARQLAAVLVQPVEFCGVRRVTVAGVAARRVARLSLARHPYAVGVLGGRRIAAAGYLVVFRGMALGATEIQSLRLHVDVQITLGLGQRRVQVTVFDRISPATEKVAGAAACARGPAYALGDLGQVRRLAEISRVGRPFHRPIVGMSRQPRQFLVGAGGVVTDDAVDVFLGGEIEALVAEAVTHVTGGAEPHVAGGGGAEIVDNMLFAKLLSGVRVEVVPGPVLGLVDLFGCLRVTGQTGFGHSRTIVEISLQCLELAVIRGRCGLAGAVAVVSRSRSRNRQWREEQQRQGEG